MTLWRINHGLPSVADGLLVSVAFPAGLVLFVRTIDPVLNYFEPIGLIYLGYVVLLGFYGGVGAIGFVLFKRNQRTLRSEIIGPRLMLAVTGPMLFLIFRALLTAAIFPAVLQKQLTFAHAWLVIDVGLLAALFAMYVATTHAALLWPRRTLMIALWINLGLGTLGMAAKAITLFRR